MEHRDDLLDETDDTLSGPTVPSIMMFPPLAIILCKFNLHHHILLIKELF